MVQKSKGGKKWRSVKSGKNKKLEMKHHRKFNYKKNKIKEKEECVICYEEVEKKNDNMIQCGKKLHILCGKCKFKMINDLKNECPMCRSHKIPQPKESNEILPIFSKGTRFGKKYTYQDWIDVWDYSELNRPRHLTK